MKGVSSMVAIWLILFALTMVQGFNSMGSHHDETKPINYERRLIEFKLKQKRKGVK